MTGILSLDVETDRPGERLSVHRVTRLPGVEFWTVRDSMRHWAMHHDTFTASLVAGRPSMNATWLYRGRKQDVSAGQMQLMEPGEAHATTSVSEPASFFVIWWHPDVLMQASESLGVRGAVHLKVSQTDHPGLQASFRGLLAGVQHASDPVFIEEQFLDSTLQLLELCGERKPPSRPPGSHPAMSRVRAPTRRIRRNRFTRTPRERSRPIQVPRCSLLQGSHRRRSPPIPKVASPPKRPSPHRTRRLRPRSRRSLRLRR